MYMPCRDKKALASVGKLNQNAIAKLVVVIWLNIAIYCRRSICTYMPLQVDSTLYITSVSRM